MAWNPPNSFTSGTALPSAEMNKIRDSLKAVGDPWIAYTPNWTAATTNPSIGNGSVAGAYILAGKLCHFRIIVSMGSTTAYGTGAYSLTLPANPYAYPIDFTGVAFVGSPNTSYPLWGLARTSTTQLDLLADPTTAGATWRLVTPTVPTTWASGNAISISGTYQVA